MMRITDKYVFFYGGVFSQWFEHEMLIDDVYYNCAEQYMMAMKAKTFGDTHTLGQIMATHDPSRQKALGRAVANFDPHVWNDVCKDFVYKANLAKFSGELKDELMKTGDREIVEASPTDKIWGIGLTVWDDKALDKANWQGTNWLGECIMQVRETLRDEANK